MENSRKAIRKARMAATLALAIAICGLPERGAAATRYDPDWPCQQIKVPSISLAAIWSGPALDGLADQWQGDPDVADLVAKLAARRTPLDDVQKLIDAFGEKAGADRRKRLLLVFAGLFQELNRQRDELMSGLARVARRQSAFASQIRAENHDFLELRGKPDSDPAKLKELSDKLDWDMRIFDDRRRSIGFACEVPVLIEQRIFAIARMIEAKLE